MRLLDANVFIEAENRYYGFDLVPAFWAWLEDQATAGEIASTDMVYDELKDGGDATVIAFMWHIDAQLRACVLQRVGAYAIG